MRSKTIFALVFAVAAFLLLVVARASTQETLTPKEEERELGKSLLLGKELFFDTDRKSVV